MFHQIRVTNFNGDIKVITVSQKEYDEIVKNKKQGKKIFVNANNRKPCKYENAKRLFQVNNKFNNRVFTIWAV